MILDDYNIYVFGENESGFLGIDNKKSQVSPIKLEFFQDKIIKSIHCGGLHAFISVLNDDKEEFYCLGNNKNGQLGIGNLRHQHSPCLFEMNKEFEGENITLKLTYVNTYLLVSNQVYSCGCNADGRLGYDYGSDQKSLNLMTFFKDKKVINIFGKNEIKEYTFKESKLKDIIQKNEYQTVEEALKDLKEIKNTFSVWKANENISIKEIEEDLIIKPDPNTWKKEDNPELIKYIQNNIKNYSNLSIFKEIDVLSFERVRINEEISMKLAKKLVIEKLIEDWSNGDTKFQNDFQEIIKDIPTHSKEVLKRVRKEFTFDYVPKWKKKVEELEIQSNPLKSIKILNEKLTTTTQEHQNEIFSLNQKYEVSEKTNNLLLRYLVVSNESKEKVEFKDFVFENLSKDFNEILASNLSNNEKITQLEALIQIITKTYPLEELKKEIERKIYSFKNINQGLLIQ